MHCLADPDDVGIEASYEYFSDGLLVTQDDVIYFAGEMASYHGDLCQCDTVHEVRNGLIVPGFIDTHIHYPQTDMMASYGEQLLDWLNKYTFPEELQFADKTHATEVAKRFLTQLLSNGTTTALVFGTVHPESVDAFFEQAHQLDLRMICGKVWMDRNAPADLLDTPDLAYQQSQALIERWHGVGRLHYAITPRFAPTSSPEQLALAGKLLSEHDELYLHTHLSENQKECEWVHTLFPQSKHYLDVYDQHKLLGERSVFAHGIHLCDDELHRLHETDSAIAFCPTSNLFLGSGLFALDNAQKAGVNVGLGTDVGAGTSFSLWQTMGEAYKTQQLRGQSLHPLKAFYLATRGGAKALQLENKIGSLETGTDADFVVLDFDATPMLSQRLKRCRNIEETLFCLMFMADDRAISTTVAAGKVVYQKPR